MKKPLTKTIKWFFGIGSMFYILWGTFHEYYLSYILTHVMKLPLTNVGVITSVSSIGTLILAVISGFVIQSIKPGKMGRYRKANMILIVLNFLLVWTGYTQFTSNVAALTIILTITLSFTKWLNNINNSARNMLCTEVAPDAAGRSLLVGHKAIYQGLGKILYSLIGVGVLALVQSRFSEGASYPIVFEIFAFTPVLGYIFDIYITRGYDYTAELQETAAANAAAPAAKKNKPSFFATVKAAFSSLPLASTSLGFMFARMPALFGTSLMVYYYNYVAEDNTLQTVAVTANSVMAMLNGIIGPWLVKKLGNKRTYLLMTLICVLGLGIVFLFALNSAAAFSIGAVLVVSSMDLSLIPIVGMFGDCAIYAEYRTGLENKAITMNMYSVFSTIGGFIKNWLQPIALGMSGYVAGEIASTAVKQGLVNAYVFFPGICIVLTILIIGFGYRLKDSDISRMEAEITARKQGGGK